MIKMYGINNCDSVKKARRWLDERQIEYHFHDFKTAGVPEDKLAQWLTEFGWERVLNRRSKSWRALDPEQRAQMSNELAVRAAMDTPTLIKRPVTEHEHQTLIGFDPTHFEQLI